MRSVYYLNRDSAHFNCAGRDLKIATVLILHSMTAHDWHDQDHSHLGVICHPNATKFEDSGFSRSRDMSGAPRLLGN